MHHRTPLHIHLLFHPGSERARTLAHELLGRWMGRPASHGLRVPVFLTPEREGGVPPEIESLRLEGAARNLVMVLVDRRMARRVAGGHADAWAVLVHRLLGDVGSNLAVLPVAVDRKAFQLDEQLSERLFVTLPDDPDDRIARLTFFASVRALYLLRDETVPEADSAGEVEAPVKLFFSHAKADLGPDHLDPVRATQDALKDLPIREWFDAREIRPGARLEDDIRRGMETSDAAVVYLTDAWATRPWCRAEGLLAKELNTPMLVVDALQDGEPRNFPYGGNTRTLRWRCPVRPGDDREAWRTQAAVEAHRILAGAVLEAMRRLHARRQLEGLRHPGDVVLDSAPEAADLAHHPPGSTYFYPDPPLDRGEHGLLSRIDPNARFETPIVRLAGRRSDRDTATIAASISEPDDLSRLGLADAHFRTLTDEVHLYLLVAGLRIAYGGKLDPNKLDDPDNFTLRLFDLVRSYRDLAREAGAERLQPILNMAPWPLWKQYDDDVLDVFGDLAELVECPLPDIGVAEADLSPLPNGFVPPATPVQQYAWGRALTAMRQHVTDEAAARICIGGRIDGYKGRMAGLIEEPLLSLRAGRPLYLVGAFGGCTQVVADLLEQRDRPEMTTAWARQHQPGYDALAAEYAARGADFPTREAVAAEIRGFGAGGPAQALRNGLADAENRELFRSTDPHRIATLVLTGLERLGV